MTNLLRTGSGGRDRTMFRGLAPVMALWIAAASAVGAGPGKSACDLLTMPEVAKVLGAAVSIAQDASGPDPNGGDNCVWNTADRRNVMVRVVAVADKNMVDLKFKLELGNAFGRSRPPEVLKGLTDEAHYRTYDGNLKGGVVVGRKAQTVFVVEGLTSREYLIDLTRALLSRL